MTHGPDTGFERGDPLGTQPPFRSDAPCCGTIATGDRQAAISSVGFTELVHGIYRMPTAEIRFRREAFLRELLWNVIVYPYTEQTAWAAGKIDGEQRNKGITVPFCDLLIGATALSIGFSVLTGKARHFRLIPGLTLVPF